MKITLKQLRAYEKQRRNALKLAELMWDQGERAGSTGDVRCRGEQRSRDGAGRSSAGVRAAVGYSVVTCHRARSEVKYSRFFNRLYPVVETGSLGRKIEAFLMLKVGLSRKASHATRS